MIEYVVLTVIILSGLYVMKDTMMRGIFGKEKQAGDSFAFGRQYDPRRTTICRQDVLSYKSDGTAVLSDFYDEDCYQARVSRPPSRGGCPQCRPGDRACFNCENAIKRWCARNEYCKT